VFSLTGLRQSADLDLPKPQWLFGLRQQGNDCLFRLILRLCRKIKRIEPVFPPYRSLP
jgi:hypothetical protein